MTRPALDLEAIEERAKDLSGYTDADIDDFAKDALALLARVRELEQDQQHLLGVVQLLRDRIRSLEAVIRRVLDDEESRPGGWGPDVTAVGWLREALDGKGGGS